MCEWLIEQHIVFEMHKVLPNGRVCDFYFGGIYWEMDGMDRHLDYFAQKYGDLPYVVVAPEDFKAIVARHLGIAHAMNGDPIVSIEPCGEAMTYDIEMAPNGPLNYIANRIVSHNSHAVAYGMITYQTAYLKANHGVAYMTALLSSVKDRTEKLAEYIEDARRYGIAVLPPDVNESGVDFTAVGSQIRFGLSAVKGVGEEAVRAIIEARERGGPFSDLFDLAARVNARQVNRRVFEALVKCGATDALPGNRAEKLAALDLAVDLATRATRDAELGQVSLFGDGAAGTALAPVLPRLNPPSQREMLAWEKEMLGIFVSGHPLAGVQDRLVLMGATPIKELRALDDDAPVTVAGAVSSLRRATTRAGGQILVAQLEDTTGSCEVVVFPKLYTQVQQLFEPDRILIVKGRLRLRERPGATSAEEPPIELSVGAHEVAPFEAPVERGEIVRGWHIDVSERTQIDRLAALIDAWPGDAPVTLHAHGKVRRLPRTIAGDVRVRPELERIFGGEHVREA